MPKEIVLIYAATRAGVIGDSKTNSMPWPRLKKDMQFFKETTTGHSVIMGRKTFDSLKKALPNRQNIVITRQNLDLLDCVVTHSLEEALAKANSTTVFIVGGAEIYKMTMALASKIYRTTVKTDFSGNVLIETLSGNWQNTTLYEDDQILIEVLIRV